MLARRNLLKSAVAMPFAGFLNFKSESNPTPFTDLFLQKKPTNEELSRGYAILNYDIQEGQSRHEALMVPFYYYKECGVSLELDCKRLIIAAAKDANGKEDPHIEYHIFYLTKEDVEFLGINGPKTLMVPKGFYKGIIYQSDNLRGLVIMEPRGLVLV